MCPKKFPFPKKVSLFNLFNQSNYLILNTIMFNWAKVFVEIFFALKLFQSFLRTFFFLKFTVSTFIIVSLIKQLGFGTTSVLFATLIMFYKIYCLFWIVITRFLSVIDVLRITFFKSWSAERLLSRIFDGVLNTTLV